MSEDVFLICVYYFSLPEFPNNCAIAKNNSLPVRDVLVSNPRNPHIKYGGQYDPHYEHDFAPQFKMCARNARRKIMSLIDNDAYSQIYLLFRTNRVLLSKPNVHLISGYYDVDLDATAIDPNYDQPVIYAKEARFADLEAAIDISVFLKRHGYYRSPFSSETKDGAFEKTLSQWKEKIRTAQNVLDDYIAVTKGLGNSFKYYEFEEGTYPLCRDCAEIDRCLLTKRIRKKGKLYHQLPKDIARRINRHYKRTIKTPI